MSPMLDSTIIGGAASQDGRLGGPSRDELEATAREFESVFLAQMLRGMTGDLEGDGPLGGGDGDPFRSMLTDEIAKLISRAGGVGVGDAVLQEMLKMQEVA